jgi:hypothetical protein
MRSKPRQTCFTVVTSNTAKQVYPSAANAFFLQLFFPSSASSPGAQNSESSSTTSKNSAITVTCSSPRAPKLSKHARSSSSSRRPSSKSKCSSSSSTSPPRLQDSVGSSTLNARGMIIPNLHFLSSLDRIHHSWLVIQHSYMESLIPCMHTSIFLGAS